MRGWAGFAAVSLLAALVVPACCRGSRDVDAVKDWADGVGDAIPDRTRTTDATGPGPAKATPAEPGRVDIRSVPDEALQAASFEGRYRGALAAVFDPPGAAPLAELGFTKAGDAAGFGPVPAGFRVRSGEWLIVWDFRDGQRGP